MRMNTLLTLVMTGLFCQISPGLSAQNQLSLEEAVLVAQRLSPMAREAYATWQAAEAQYRLAIANQGFSLDMAATLPGLNRQIEPLLLDDGTQSFITRSQSYSYSSLQARQPLPFSGGTLHVSSGLHFIHNFGQLRSSFWQSTPLLLEVQQPILQPNRWRWDRQIAESARQHASLQYRVSMENLAQEARTRFFEALAGQIASRHAIHTLQVLDTLAGIARQRRTLGSATEGEWLQIRQQQLQAATLVEQLDRQSHAARSRLAHMLGLDPVMLPVLAAPSAPGQTQADWDFLRHRMMAQAASLSDQRLQSLHLSRSVAEAQARHSFRADVILSLGLNQTGNSLLEAYKSPQWRQFGTVAVQVPLASAGRKQAELTMLHQQEQALRAQTTRQELELTVAWEQLVAEWDLGNQQLSRTALIDSMARRGHELAVQRYLLGRGSLPDVLLAQQSWETAQVAHFQALQDRWLALGQLRLLTLFDPRFDQPLPWPPAPQP